MVRAVFYRLVRVARRSRRGVVVAVERLDQPLASRVNVQPGLSRSRGQGGADKLQPVDDITAARGARNASFCQSETTLAAGNRGLLYRVTSPKVLTGALNSTPSKFLKCAFPHLIFISSAGASLFLSVVPFVSATK